MTNEMRNDNKIASPCFPPLDVDAAVVMELRFLAECPPNGTMSDRDLMVQTYMYGDCVITHRTVGDTLPMPSDSPVYYYLKAVHGKARQTDSSVSSITVKIRDVINGIGLTTASSAYASVRTAITRFSRLKIRIERPDGSVSEFCLFDFRVIDKGTVRIDFAPGYLEEIDSGDRKVHYLALGHVIRLGGLATSLYAILQSRLFHTGRSNVSGRKFIRVWLGEERGNDIPVSRAYSSYLVPRIREIAEETGWKIAVEKVGRAEKSRYLFRSITNMPQAFEVREQWLKSIQSDALAAANAQAVATTPDPVPASVPAKPKTTAKVQAKNTTATLSPAVIAALPSEAAENNTIVTALASVNASDALRVIEYVNGKSPQSFSRYLAGILKNRSIKSLVAELKADAKKHAEALVPIYREVLFNRQLCGDETFKASCRLRRIDPDEAIAWGEENAPELMAPKAE